MTTTSRLLADVKTLNENANKGDFDKLLIDMIDGITDAADEYMGVKYTRATEQTVYFDGGVKSIYLPHANVSAVTVYFDDELLTVDYDYTLYPETGIIRSRFENGFAKGNRIIRVVYDGGYLEDALPMAFRRKIVKQTNYEFRRRNDAGLSSVTFPNGTINKYQIDEWLPDVKAELDRRRRLVI